MFPSHVVYIGYGQGYGSVLGFPGSGIDHRLGLRGGGYRASAASGIDGYAREGNLFLRLFQRWYACEHAVEQIFHGASAHVYNLHQEVHLLGFLLPKESVVIGQCGLHAPYEGAGLFHAELHVEIVGQRLFAVLGTELRGPERVVWGIDQRTVAAIGDGMVVIYGLIERDGLDVGDAQVAFAAGLERQEQVE